MCGSDSCCCGMDDEALRQELVEGLDGGHAHFKFVEATANFPMERINDLAPNSDYTPWRLLEHMRLTQRDILDYIGAVKYEERKWPEEYWPDPKMKATAAMWKKTVKGFLDDREKLMELVKDEGCDLFGKVKWGKAKLFREVRIVINHNSYHIGEFCILRSVMKTWKK